MSETSLNNIGDLVLKRPVVSNPTQLVKVARSLDGLYLITRAIMLGRYQLRMMDKQDLQFEAVLIITLN